jgi:cytochrome c biogenesis protein CcmG, thiol:disulfide interchange protein DsbE
MRIDRFLPAATAAMFLAFLGSLYGALHEIQIGPGDIAPAFTLTADSGQRISPTDFGGKALLLNFWATWCEPCQAELPSLKALAQSLAAEGLVVLAVSEDSDLSAYRRLAGQMPRILTIRQPEKTIQLSYGTREIPETYLIDRTGRVRAKFISNQDWTAPGILSQIRSLIAE